MKNINILQLIASLLLLTLFAVPLWRITLSAPQYPGGISMYIWINKITGDTDYTLQNINILNHYIGMKYIVPDEFPEFDYFPFIVIAMAVLGSAMAFLKKWKFTMVWLVVLLVLGSLGIYDFYLWEYDYGHNLDPNAAIKIPGMAYQPPLLGSKMLLNFEATSYPYWGGLFLGLSIFLSAFSIYKRMRK